MHKTINVSSFESFLFSGMKLYNLTETSCHVILFILSFAHLHLTKMKGGYFLTFRHKGGGGRGEHKNICGQQVELS